MEADEGVMDRGHRKMRSREDQHEQREPQVLQTKRVEQEEAE